MSGLDPKEFSTTAEGSLADRVADLERRVSALRQTPPVAMGDGEPTVDLPDGWLYVNRLTSRLYVRVSGAWKYATLT